MKSSITRMLRSGLALACCVGATGVALAATIDLTGLGFVQYGDAQSYSMPIANFQYGYNTNNGPFAISSTPGQISPLVVLATGSSGTPVTNNFAGMDNAYATPSGVSGSTFFYANPFTDQGVLGTVNHDLANTWDTSLAALKTFLAGDQMVVFFNNNQVNSGASSNQNLAAWGRIWITDAAGNDVGSTYEMTNNNGAYNLVSMGGGGTFFGDVTTYTAPGSGPGDPSPLNGGGTAPNGTDYVLSGGALCVESGGSVFIPIPVPCGSAPTHGGTTVSAPINHNLGADHVAYSILFPELNAELGTLFSNSSLDLSLYTMHADIRLGCGATQVITGANGKLDYGTTAASGWMTCDIYNGFGSALNNGFEQIFIGTATVNTCPATDPLCNPTVPEPGSLLLVAAALVALGWSTRRRSVKSDFFTPV